MKYVMMALACLCGINACTGQNNKNKNKDMDEKLDVNRLVKNGEQTVYDDGTVLYYWEYTEEDGTKVVIEGDKKEGFTESRIPKNSYYEIYKEYFPSGMLKQKGALLGEHTAIGMWYYYDKHGKLIQTVDEDKKFGKFGCLDVVDFLIQKDYVAKDTYLGIFNIKIAFVVEDSTWFISLTLPGYMINEYTLDGNTGEVKKHEVFQGGKM
jgi:YD repeat-containing protein